MKDKITIIINAKIYTINEENDVKKFIDDNDDIKVVYGKGWSLSIFEGEEVGKGPKKEHLDEVSRDIPIVLSILGFKWCMDPEIYKELIDDDRLKIRVSAGFSNH